MAMEAGGDAASCDRDGHAFHLDGVVHDSACSYRDEHEFSSHASCCDGPSSSCLSSASSPSCDESCSSCARWTMTETWIASFWSLTPLAHQV